MVVIVTTRTFRPEAGLKVLLIFYSKNDVLSAIFVKISDLLFTNKLARLLYNFYGQLCHVSDSSIGQY